MREGGDSGGGSEQGLSRGVYYVVGEVVEDGGLEVDQKVHEARQSES